VGNKIRKVFIDIKLADASLQYYPNFIDYGKSLKQLEDLYAELDWQQESLFMYGKKVSIPRLQAWYGDDSMDYTYTNLTLTAKPWTPIVFDLKQKVETLCQHKFNSVLANCYRDQQDSVSWHSDDEPELGKEPVIASLSFGAKRTFHLKHKVTGEKFNLPLQSGSLLVMSGRIQSHWQHAVLKSRLQMAMRINLTFRQIKSS